MNPPFARSLGRGGDPMAAVRHFRAALSQLAPGGRLVAIMPDGFAPSGSADGPFETSVAGCTVRTSLRLSGAFRKHGTSVAVRVYVVDRVEGLAAAATLDRADVGALIDALAIPDRPEAATNLPEPAPRRTAAVSMFRAVRSRPAPPPRIYRAPVGDEVRPVEYARLIEPAPVGEPAGVYLAYRASRIALAAAGDHPTPLVESSAMGSIPAPIPDHVPHLPERVVTARLLSAAQLETVVYAGHAWAQLLPGRFRPEREGVGLALAEDGDRYRTGYFLGDGTGAGKGRQIAACILDNWLAGRRRAISPGGQHHVPPVKVWQAAYHSPHRSRGPKGGQAISGPGGRAVAYRARCRQDNHQSGDWPAVHAKAVCQAPQGHLCASRLAAGDEFHRLQARRIDRDGRRRHR